VAKAKNVEMSAESTEFSFSSSFSRWHGKRGRKSNNDADALRHNGVHFAFLCLIYLKGRPATRSQSALIHGSMENGWGNG